jgi:hypothetical protein
MDHIDVHDLSEDEARVLTAFVEFLRSRKQEAAQQEVRQAETTPLQSPFAVWPLGVKGSLSREEIYDHL